MVNETVKKKRTVDKETKYRKEMVRLLKVISEQLKFLCDDIKRQRTP